MKKILVLLSALLLSQSAIAHGGHAKINAENALKIAKRTAKLLTFKESQLSVGKLDASWQNAENTQFILSSEMADEFVIKAVNKANKQELYFTVGKDGKIIDVVEAK